MKKYIFFLFILTCSIIYCQKNKLNIVQINGAEAVEGELIVKFKSPFAQNKANQITSARQKILSDNEAIPIKKFKIGAEHWRVKNKNLEQMIEDLNNNELVEYAEPNYILRTHTIPNDPQFNNQWGLHNTGQYNGTADVDIDAPEAWNISTGDEDIVVGIIDTGIDYLHPDLVGNIWSNPNEIPNNGIDDDNNGYVDDNYGWDFKNNDNDPMDNIGHGTRVAGVIAAESNNDLGVTGVAWNCKLMALKITSDEVFTSLSYAIEAIEYSINMSVSIINSSWGFYAYSQSVYDVIKLAGEHNVIIVASAGNEGRNTEIWPLYPAAYNLDNIISVGSIRWDGTFYSYSNYSITSVDVSAPGDGQTTGINNSYTYFDGTSCAAPFVTGACVLVKSVFDSFNAIDIKNQILGSVIKYSSLEDKVKSGGMVNVYNAIYSDKRLKLKIIEQIISFGELPLGEVSTSQSVELNNSSSEELTIDSIVVDSNYELFDDDNNVTHVLRNLEISPHNSKTIKLRFNPTELGYIKSYLYIHYKGTLNNNREIIELNGIADNSLEVDGWPISLSTQFSPVPIDVDGDNIKEIITPDDGYIKIFDSSGELINKWRISLQTGSEIAVGDIDNDGINEIVTGSGGGSSYNEGKVFAYELDGSSVTGWPVNTSFNTGSPVLADLNNDGFLDIIVGEVVSNKLYLIHHDGTFHDGWPVQFNKGTFYLPIYAISDVDNNGYLDVITIVTRFKENITESIVHCLEYQGNELDGFPLTLNDYIFQENAIAVGDVNNDSNDEIIIFSINNSVGQGKLVFYIISNEGKILRKKVTSGSSYGRLYGPSLSDFNLDGAVDISYIKKTDKYDSLYIYDYNLDKELTKELAINSSLTQNTFPVISDLTGNNYPDVIVASGKSIFALTQNLDPINNFPITKSGGFSNLILDDILNDGYYELLSLSNSTMHLFKINKNHNSHDSQWITFKHDYSRTSNINGINRLVNVNVKKLQKNWNLVSLNQEMKNDSTHIVFNDVLDNTVIILGYDNGGLTYNPSIDNNFNSLHKISNKSSYWIKLEEDDGFYTVGHYINPQTPIELYAGWNLISYLPEKNDSIHNALNSIIENITVVMGFDGEGLTFYPNLSDDINSLTIMSPGFGYWVKVTKTDTLIYPAKKSKQSYYKPLVFNNDKSKMTISKKVTATTEWINVYTENLEINGNPVEAGMKVIAKDPEGIICGEFIVKNGGKIGLMPVYRDDFTTAEIDEGADPGDEITIYVNDYELPQKIKWERNGQLVNLGDYITSIETEEDIIPTKYDISQNYPNPFNPTTSIQYQLPKEGLVELKIYNILGEEVKTLVNKFQEPGYYDISWNGTNNKGYDISSGVYIYRLSSDDFTKSKKMIILK